MKAVALCASTLLVVAGCAAVVNAQGFKAAFTLAGLQNFEQAIVAFVNKEFQDLTLPDMHLQPDVPVVGKIDLDLTNIVITGFDIPSASFTLTPPNGIAAGVSGTGLQVKMNFHWRKHSWPHISDHGDLTATPKQGDLNAAMAVTVSNGVPYFSATSTTANFDKIDIHFSGHWDDWLYNLIVDLFKNTIKNDVDKAIQGSLTNVINVSINKALAKLPTHLHFGGGHSREDLDISTTAVTATSTYLGLANEFAISDNSTGAACPTAPAPIPDVDPQSHQLQFFVAASVLNCAVWVPYTNDALQWHVPATVDFWSTFIPNLDPFKGMNLTSLITPLDGQPTVTMSAADGVTATMSFSVNQSVILGAENFEWTDNLSFDFTFGIDLWVGPSKTVNNTNDLFGKITALQIDIGVIDSAIGDINLSVLQTIINIAEPIVTDALNGVLGAGFPLPLVPGLNLVNPQVVFGDGYFGVATDFQFGADFEAVDTNLIA